MFGTAFAYALSKKHRIDFSLSTYFLNNRPLEIDSFKLAESLKITEKKPIFHGRYSSLGKKIVPSYIDKSYIERDFHFSAKAISGDLKERYYGYFQSPKYFADLRDELKLIFTLNESSRELRDLSEEICSNSTIGIHLRRGDYLGKENYHGLAQEKYFHASVELLETNHSSAKLVIFTEDLDEAIKIFPNAWKIITPKELTSPAETLILMSKSPKFIGSNSSFSWWAAFLCKDNAQQAIFPRPWFSTVYNNDRDLLLPQWLTLGNQ